MKKTKEKQASRCEDATASNGFSYLPPSPPAQQKAPSQEQIQPSSSPLEAAFPLLMDNHGNGYLATKEDDSIDPRDCLVLEDFQSFIASRETHASSLPSPTANSHFYPFNMEPLDFPIAPLLNGDDEDFDIDQTTLFTNPTDYAFFPSLPDNTGD